MGKTTGDSSRNAEFPLDKKGIPIPLLGFSASDANSDDKSAAITTNTTIAFVVGSVYFLVIAQADTVDSGIMIVDILTPSTGAKSVRIASLTGSIVLTFKARETDMKITHVASPNTTGFIISKFELA